jgi:hypothetical protein
LALMAFLRGETHTQSKIENWPSWARVPQVWPRAL